ncbi:MAG: hypothetical protein RDU25_04800 [Patescibacteria group bacterium]|nr:hypothetical protein [Patescibacteria group bacterium]
MNMIFLGAAAGTIAGVIMLFLSHLAPFFGAGNFVRDLDDPRFFGKQITHREAHYLGVLLHVLFCLISGALFGLAVDLGLMDGTGFISVMGWSLVAMLFYGGVLMPLEGHGIFGVKEDSWFPVDLFLTNILWGVLFWWILILW